MRAISVLTASMLLLAAGTAGACPMQSVSTSKGQTVASSNGGPSTPIPAKTQRDGNG
jgi:hypothetical protein